MSRCIPCARDDLLELVVGLVDGLGRRIGEQVFEFELDDGGVAATLAVFGFLDDEGIVADHDDVADAEFLSGFHRGCLAGKIKPRIIAVPRRT